MGELILVSQERFQQSTTLVMLNRLLTFGFAEATDPEVVRLKTALILEQEERKVDLRSLATFRATALDFRQIGTHLDALPVEDAAQALPAAYSQMMNARGVRLHCTQAYRTSLPGRSAMERHRAIMPCFQRIAFAWKILVFPSVSPRLSSEGRKRL